MTNTSEFSVSDMSNKAIWLFVVTLLLPIPALLLVGRLSLGPFVLLASMALIYGAAIYIYRKTQRKMLVTISGDRITITHTQKPLFEQVTDRDCPVSDIGSYSFDTVSGARLVLYFNDGTKVRFVAGNASRKSQQIELLAQTLIPLIENSNSQQGSTQPTKRRKTFYEGTGGLVLAIGILVVIAVTIWAIIFLPNNHSTTDVVKAIGYDLIALTLALRIFSLRAKAKQKADEKTYSD